MGLLSHLAEWCREHIPLVGGAIASLVEKIDEVISPRIESIVERISGLELSLQGLRNALSSFIQDPLSYVTRIVRSVLNTVVSPLFESFTDFVCFISNSLRGLLEWFRDKASWLQAKILEFKDAIWSAIRGYIEPELILLRNIRNVLSDFIHDPCGFITRVVSGLINEAKQFVLSKLNEARNALLSSFNALSSAFNGLTTWINERVSSFTSAFMHIDDFLRSALYGFITDYAAWFVYTFLRDLFTLEYDVEAKQIIGEAKNPLTRYMIEEIEVKEPEYPYESVEEEIRG